MSQSNVSEIGRPIPADLRPAGEPAPEPSARHSNADAAALESVTPEAKPRRRWGRTLLMLLVPLLLAAGGGAWWWLTRGQVATDNAYVQQNKVSIAPEVAGRIVEVAVAENQRVNRGDLLFRIDPAPYEIALMQADAALSSARLQVRELRAGVGAKVADVASAQAAVTNARASYQRQQELLQRGFTTRAAYDQALAALRQAEQQVAADRANVESARAAVGGGTGPVDQHPLVRAAMAQRAQAALNLSRTTVRAPAEGIVSQIERLQVGGLTPAQLPVATLVTSGRTWVEANFKETQLEDLRVGQPATVELDIYPDLKIRGMVESLGAGTGSEFSVLPAQNATGNWVKVTQRVPVRIRLLDAPADRPLIAGMSAHVTVDTRGGGAR